MERNLNHLVELIRILNIDTGTSSICAPYQQLLTQDGKIDPGSSVISDVDEELLVLIEFTQVVRLNSVKIYYCPPNIADDDDIDISGPKQIHIYSVQDLNVDFGSIPGVKSKLCKKSIKLFKGQSIRLNSLKTQKLIIYSASNQANTTQTAFSGMSFRGSFECKQSCVKSNMIQKVQCNQCCLEGFKPNKTHALNTNNIRKITQHKLDPDHRNTHRFQWIFDSLSDVQTFVSAKANDITFRSDYHMIDGEIFYFEITPNGTVDRINIDAGWCNIWLNLYQSTKGKEYVRLRFQCVCVNDNMSFIGEGDATLNPKVGHVDDCRGSNKSITAISTNNAMRFTNFKHLNKISFIFNVTLNPDKIVQRENVDIKDELAADTKQEELVKDIRRKPSQNGDRYKQCLSCDGNIKQCDAFITLLRIITEYNIHNKCETALKEIVDLFHHLLLHHDDDDEFEYIMGQMPACNVLNCSSFGRNYRDRKKNSDYLLGNDTNTAKQQTLDTIHCYFLHSMDIGHRLNSQQRLQLQNIQTQQENEADEISKDTQEKPHVERKHDDNDDVDLNNAPFRNYVFSKLKQFQTQQMRTRGSLCTYRYNKYRTFNPQLYNAQNKEASKQYSYGQLFFYVPNKYGIVNVLPRYKSLKEEMLQNPLCQMTIATFNSEKEKADAHLGSRLCKKLYPQMVLEHVLSLMIYCNCDVIQFEFSKTYRGQTIYKHNQFYYFGYYLYVAVNKYGSNTKNVHKLYHGVNDKLTFPDVIGPRMGIKMNSPLSTSTSLEVAARFATNEGLLVQFGGPQLICTGFETKHFAVSWLSDYVSERECLFIGTSAGLYINNITSVADCTHYLEIIHVLHNIQSQIEIGSQITIMRVTAIKMVCDIIENQLSNTRFVSPLMDTYGQSLVDMYCKSREIVSVKCVDKKQYFTKYFYPHIDNIQIMFPNVTDIVLRDVDKKDMNHVLDCVLNIWRNVATRLRLEIVRIYPNTTQLSDDQTIEYYVNSIIFLNAQGFTQNKHVMKSHDNNKCIILLLNSKIIEPDPIDFEVHSKLIREFTKSLNTATTQTTSEPPKTDEATGGESMQNEYDLELEQEARNTNK